MPIPTDSTPVSPRPSDDFGGMAPSGSCQSLTSIGRSANAANSNGGNTNNASVFDRYASHNKSFSGTVIPAVQAQSDDLSKDLSSSSTSLNKSAPMRSVSSSVSILILWIILRYTLRFRNCKY